MSVLARVAGAACSAGTVVLWAVFVGRNARGALDVALPAALLVASIFGLLGLAGAWAALKGSPAVLTVVGFIALVPVGAYLILFPGIFRWIGVLDAGMLAVGVAGLVGARKGEDPAVGEVGPGPDAGAP